MGKAFSRYSGGRACYIPIILDTGCSKSIISEEAVRALGSHINELERSLNIIALIFDPNKSLRLIIDAASTEGAGFVLF